jgi:hypothetical protein
MTISHILMKKENCTNTSYILLNNMFENYHSQNNMPLKLFLSVYISYDDKLNIVCIVGSANC